MNEFAALSEGTSCDESKQKVTFCFLCYKKKCGENPSIQQTGSRILLLLKTCRKYNKYVHLLDFNYLAEI